MKPTKLRTSIKLLVAANIIGIIAIAYLLGSKYELKPRTPGQSVEVRDNLMPEDSIETRKQQPTTDNNTSNESAENIDVRSNLCAGTSIEWQDDPNCEGN